jgi:hypothetical protein
MGLPKVMQLLDASTGLMECKVCGARHVAMVKSGGGYQRGHWQCPHGCKLDDKVMEEPQQTQEERR